MTNTPDGKPVPENQPVLEEKVITPPAQEDDDMFGDLEFEETPDDIRRDRDSLRQKIADAEASIGRTRRDNAEIQAKIDAQRAESDNAIAALKDSLEAKKADAIREFLILAAPISDTLVQNMSAITPEQRAADTKFDKTVLGIEKVAVQLKAVFNKYAAKDDAKPVITEENKPAEVKAADAPKAETTVEETAEMIAAERDALRTKFAGMGADIMKARSETAKLATQLTRQKDELVAIVSRTQAQLAAQKDFVLEKFLKDMLPAVDNLERGLKTVKKTQGDAKFDNLAQVLETALAGMTGVFNKFGVVADDPVGQPFDDSKHEALSTNDTADVEPDTVVSVFEKGYILNGRVIRNAKVVVRV